MICINSRIMNINKLICVGLVVSILASCNNDVEIKEVLNDRIDIPLTSAEEKLSDDIYYQFAMEVYYVLSSQSEAGNIVFSPASLLMSASMLANGARGGTQDEILKALGCTSGELDDLNSLNRKLMSYLPQLDKTSSVLISNSVWFDAGLGSPKAEIKEKLYDNYGAQLTGLADLSSFDALKTINNWCKEATGGQFSSVMNAPGQDGSKMMLFNVFGFKGKWKEQFDRSLTEDKAFYSESGTISMVPMMKNPKMTAVGYGTDKYTAVSLPYGNGAYSMIIILPDKGCHISDCITRDEMNNIKGLALMRPLLSEKLQARTKSLNIEFPRFAIESNVDFVDVLKSLGVNKSFDENNADFTNFFETGGCVINGVSQTSKVIVDETGTEAVSVSKWDGGATSDFAELVDFVVDRPFVFLITEKSVGLPLFVGKISEL